MPDAITIDDRSIRGRAPDRVPVEEVERFAHDWWDRYAPVTLRLDVYPDNGSACFVARGAPGEQRAVHVRRFELERDLYGSIERALSALLGHGGRVHWTSIEGDWIERYVPQSVRVRDSDGRPVGTALTSAEAGQPVRLQRLQDVLACEPEPPIERKTFWQHLIEEE